MKKRKKIHSDRRKIVRRKIHQQSVLENKKKNWYLENEPTEWEIMAEWH